MGLSKECRWVALCGATFAFWTSFAFVFMLTMQFDIVPGRKPAPVYMALGWGFFFIAVVGWFSTLRLCYEE
jgi:hypothetical protein